MTRKTSGDKRAGFTLIELLVVVLIIGILAAMAIPQYFKVVEKSRLSEAQAFISAMRSAQERYLARYGTYSLNSNINGSMDIQFTNCAATGNNCGMKTYTFTALANSACAGGAPGYFLNVTRIAGGSPRYGNYTVIYNRCNDVIVPNCANCAELQ